MPGSDYAASAKIKASVAAVIRRIAEQGAGRGAWAEFVSGSGCLVGIAEATEHPKVTVVRRSAEKTLIGCRGATPLTVLAIQEVGGRVQRLDPVLAGHAGLEKKTANAVSQSADDALSFAVLGGCVWTGQAKHSTVGSEVST
jgi:hypothetical protein